MTLKIITGFLCVFMQLLPTRCLAEQTLIAVASNFTDAAKDLVQVFEQTSSHKVTLSFGSTGKLYAQIAQGAPYDALLAADLARPLKAEQTGLAVENSRFTYALGKLVFWSSKSDLYNNGAEYLSNTAAQPNKQRLAIANPATAPYGAAAQQVLEHLNLWQTLQPRLVRGDSIAQTFQFIVSGNAEAGFIAHAQLINWKANQGSAWHVPESLYEPIAQQAVLLKHGANNAATVAFLSFLREPPATAIILEHGYGVE